MGKKYFNQLSGTKNLKAGQNTPQKVKVSYGEFGDMYECRNKSYEHVLVTYQ